ncbi:MAG: PEP-CTERM sorting domain-containing protein [Planctomycetia bacterium]|nr:PEP-CTERM sorting domain-containing protein [Planctomycetia bacterium]
MSKNLLMVWVLLWVGTAVPCWGKTYEIKNSYGTSTVPVTLESAISATLAIGDTIRITGGTSYWDSPYTAGITAGTSMNERITTEVTGGSHYFDRVYCRFYRWGEVTLTFTVSGANTTVSAGQVYNWNPGGIWTVKEGATVTVGSKLVDDSYMAHGAQLNLETGGSLTLPRLNIIAPSQDPDGPAIINVSGQSTLKINEYLTLRAGKNSTVATSVDRHSVLNLYGGGNTITVGSTFSAENYDNTTPANLSELNVFIDSTGASCIQAKDVSIEVLKTSAQLQYSGALTDQTSYNIVTATGSFVGPALDNLTDYAGGTYNNLTDLWTTNKSTNNKQVNTALNANFSDGSSNFDCMKTITKGEVGWLTIGATKTGVTYDLTTTFAGDATAWSDFATHFVQGMGGYTSYTIDNAAQSITFEGIDSANHYLSWDTSTFTGGTFTLASVQTVSSGFTYQLDPVASGQSGYGTAASPVGILSLCENISPNDTIVVSSGENYFKALGTGFDATTFPGSLQGNRIKIQFTGGTSQLENLNTLMNLNNSTTYYPYVDLVISGEDTTVSATRMYNFNQGSTITVKEGGTLTVGSTNASEELFALGNTLTVDGGNLNMATLTIQANSQNSTEDRATFNVAHGSNVQINGNVTLTRTDMTITGENAITLGGLTTEDSTAMNFLADATGFGKITTTGNVTATAGTISAGLASGLVPLSGKEWTILEKQGGGTFEVWGNLDSELFAMTSGTTTVTLGMNAASQAGVLSVGETVEVATGLQESGWLEWDATPNQRLEITLTVSGATEATWDAFTDFLLQGWEELGYTTTDDLATGTLSIVGIFSNDVLAWDFTSFNAEHTTHYGLLSMGNVEVPEPATWLLLLGLAGGVALLRKGNLRVRKGGLHG